MVGDTVTFSVEATGYPAPSYAWIRDGLLLGENHSTLELLDVQPNDAATYSVTVFNGNGSIDSQPVTLVVTPAALTDLEIWRERFFGRIDNEGDAADDADPDDDGSPNRDEFAAGTDPTDPESVFRIREVNRDPVGGVTLTLGTADQRRYRVLLSFNLVEWQPLMEDLEGTGAELSIPIESAALQDQSQAYFRIEVMATQP